jgi:hypothetical protein
VGTGQSRKAIIKILETAIKKSRAAMSVPDPSPACLLDYWTIRCSKVCVGRIMWGASCVFGIWGGGGIGSGRGSALVPRATRASTTAGHSGWVILAWFVVVVWGAASASRACRHLIDSAVASTCTCTLKACG